MDAFKRNGLIVAGVFLLDQAVKFCFEKNNPNIDLGIISFHAVHNTGASFSMLQGQNTALIWVSLIALGVIMMNVRHFMGKFSIPASLITAGILGNLADRLFHGYVIDWIDLKWWPVFNVADSAIFIGVSWIIILLVLEEFEEHNNKKDTVKKQVGKKPKKK